MQLDSSDGRGQFYQCLLDCGIGRRGRFEGFDYSDDSENFYTKAVAYLSEQRGTDASERFKSTLHIGLEFLKMFFGEDKVRDVVDEMCRSSPCSRLLDLLNLRNHAAHSGDDDDDAPLLPSSSLIGFVDKFEIISLLPLSDKESCESNQLRDVIAKVCV